MKTLTELLQDADPLAHEQRSLGERHAMRETVLNARHAGHDAGSRRRSIRAIAILGIIGIGLGWFQWSRSDVDVIAAVRFEVRLAEESPAPDLREASVVGTDRKVYLHGEAVVANSDIAQARVVEGDGGSGFGASVTLNALGAARMLRATQAHIGRPLAILVDGEVVAAPIVRSAISTAAIISGSFAKEEAERITGGILGR